MLIMGMRFICEDKFLCGEYIEIGLGIDGLLMDFVDIFNLFVVGLVFVVIGVVLSFGFLFDFVLLVVVVLF